MILFLDIDGVILPTDGRGILPPAVAGNVHRFISAGYRVVLHSTWRWHPSSLADAHELFRTIAVTLDGVVNVTEPSKARAITNWLDDEYGPEWPAGIVVVDDDPIDLRGVTHIRPASATGWVEPAAVPV